MPRRSFHALGWIFVIASAVVGLAGGWTFTFSETDGRFRVAELGKEQMGGFYPGIPHVGNIPRSAPNYHVEYAYEVDGKRYIGHRIGMGFRHWSLSPFSRMDWEDRAVPGARVTVYHSSSVPSFAVLHRGVDWLVVLVLAGIGGCLIAFSAWMKRTGGTQTALGETRTPIA